MAETKERIRAKAEANAKARAEQQMQQSQVAAPTYSEEELVKIFESAEKVERTPRGAKPQPGSNKLS